MSDGFFFQVKSTELNIWINAESAFKFYVIFVLAGIAECIPDTDWKIQIKSQKFH